MKKHTQHILRSAFVALLVVFIGSCSGGKETKNLPPSTGSLHEVVVVHQQKSFDSSSVGSLFIKHLSREMDGLANSEPLYNVIDVHQKGFSDVFRRHSKIVILNINDLKVRQPNIEFMKDKWALNQIVIKVNAANIDEATDFLNTELRGTVEYLLETFDWKLENKKNWTKVNKEYVRYLKDNFHAQLAIPKRFRLAVKQDDFLWFRYETQITEEGILIYKEPYTHDSTFTYDYIVSMRDSLTKRFIPGPSEGSYMKVNPIYPKTQTVMQLDSAYTVETKGLWHLESEYMGGSFISYTVLNQKRNEVITVGAFVHVPNNPKRMHMLDMEGILRTLELQ